ncbi:hypothetical protein B0920_08010 [Massilia sp. KIM]|uniref:hypothetical protein n=1 Tax=Massilia sp. KIM TaxID=1955422 RepID=UPI00098F12BF|nr:hypothetical protein [Massilia sp. KIM]OON63326.1 hypothetical protein B0920_08010 [Massilia sp. KIM]
MFQMFGVKSASCPRCERKVGSEDRYCAACGLIPGAPRNAPVLRENRWVAGPDELAVFFGVRELSGVFVKTLRVPATARAYILQGDKATEVPQGEYEIEGFFTRLNHLLRDQHAEILVTRSAALAVDFSFEDVHTCEHLPVSARLTVSIRIENVPAFARHFMTMPGTIGGAQLRELLAHPLRQLAADFIGARSIREMAGNRELREQFAERLHGGLRLLLAEYGLAATQVDTLELRHDKFDANRARVGSLWLAADEKHVQIEHARQLDELYTAEEWQRIAREEAELKLRQRRAELRQDDAIARAELSLQGADRAHGVRSRQIELYGRILEAQSRKQAIERGAGEVLAELEHEMAKKGAARADEAAEWAHLRALAQVRMRAELEAARQDATQAARLAQQRFSQQLLQQQIRNKIEQAAQIEDAVRQRAELVRLREAEADAARRVREIDEAQHLARRREAERQIEWDDEQARLRIEAARRGNGQAEALAQHEKLLRTIEADARHARSMQEVGLDAEARRADIEEARRAAERAHALELARLEIARAESLGAMDDTAKLALAAAPNAQVLGDFMKTRVHAGMDAGQLTALAAVAGAGRMTADEAARAAQDAVRAEQARREHEVDKDRRHQLDLLAMQNDVNKTALASQATLGAGLAASAAARQCVHGHPARPEDRFCAACGAALPG